MLRHFVVALGALALAVLPASAQRAPEGASPPGFRTLFTVDSARVPNLNVSPDGKWVLFSRTAAGPTSSVWMAAVADPKPFRLTSDGYTDRWPTFSPTGDRVFFISTRPNRDPRSTAKYVMSLPIDKTTGRPAGPVRQVTTDSVELMPPFGFSPDGKWLAYTVAGEPSALRLVSTTGGNARTLATKFTWASGLSNLTFSADGQRVVFQDSLVFMLREVSVTGGAVTTLYRAAKGETVTPAPYRDDRYIVHDLSTGRAELRERSGRRLGVALMPPGGYEPGRSARSTRSDGRGVIGAKNEFWYGLKRVSLATGAIEDVLSPNPGWPFGVTKDGSILRSRTVEGRQQLATVLPNGKVQHETTAGREVTWIFGLLPGGTRLLGWGPDRHPGTPRLNQYGYDIASRRVPAYLVNRTTGATKLLADSVLKRCCPRNWGADEDANGIAELRGTMVDVKSIDATGAMHLVRSFPIATFERFNNVDILGTRLAYVDSSDKNESAVFVTTSPDGSPARIALVGHQSDVALRWSPNGRKLAVAYADVRARDRATARVFDIAADGSLTSAGPALDLGGTADYFESIAWLPDESALLVMRDDRNDRSCSNCVVLRPLDPARPPQRLAPRAGGIGSFFIEPGGRSVLIEVSGYGGASIWTADFVPVKRP